MNLGIIGASGVVGMELIKLLENNHLKIKYFSIRLFGSSRSRDKIINFKDTSLKIELLDENIFTYLDIAIFCTGNDISRKYVPIANMNNCICIDHSSEFRMCKDIPLIIPEINSQLTKDRQIIASPNCCTSLLCMVLYPLTKLGSIKKVTVSTYQAASGAGINGLNELTQQIHDYSDNNQLKTDYFKRQYLLNVFSHNSDVDIDNGYNDEEIKMVNETFKILGVRVNPTCVRVPVLRSHCESVTIEFEHSIELLSVYDVLTRFSGIKIEDDKISNKFPEPINTENKFDISVGRIRHDIMDKENKTINLFLSGDQLLKGAALNSYQILKYLA
jgi:aspartate-semialdehyde dehydrogenase